MLALGFGIRCYSSRHGACITRIFVFDASVHDEKVQVLYQRAFTGASQFGPTTGNF